MEISAQNELHYSTLKFMSHNNSKGFKITLGGIVSLVTILTFLLPYLELKSKAQTNSDRITALEGIVRQDHDLIVKMASDMEYVKKAIERMAK